MKSCRQKPLNANLAIDFRRLDLFRFRNDVTLEKALDFVEVLRRDPENIGDHAYSCYAKWKPEQPSFIFLGALRAACIRSIRANIDNISLSGGVYAANIECIVHSFRIALVFHFLNLMLGNQIKDCSRLMGLPCGSQCNISGI